MNATHGPREGWGQPSGEASRQRRPRWVTLLAVLMLLAGARLFLGSLTDLRRLATGLSMAEARLDGLANADQEVLIRGQLALDEAVDRAHPVAAGVQAAARLALALVFFFAVAAVFSNDPRARRASVLAGWAGMALHLGSGVFLLAVVRQGVADAVPVLQQVAAKAHAGTGDALPTPADLHQLASTLMIQVPLLAASLGVLFSILLLVTFGGRRGRLFYNDGAKADHGWR
jgi:hypothetical protein